MRYLDSTIRPHKEPSGMPTRMTLSAAITLASLFASAPKLWADEWPQWDTDLCFYYNKPCPYNHICLRGGDPKPFMKSFRQREILYEQEKEELSNA